MNEGRDVRGWTRWGPMGADRDHRDARESASGSGSGRGGVAAAPPVRAVDAGLRWWRTRALCPPPFLPSPAHTRAGPPPPP
ncbi:unnamed protein product [Sphagnum balticum]